MKKYNFLAILLSFLILSSSISIAEDYLFNILAVKGTVKIQRSNTNKWEQLKTGDKVNKGDIIVLDANSYLGLSHFSGKMIQLKNKGEYPANQISEKINTSNSDLNSKFGKYISAQINNSQGMLDKESNTNKMKTTGSIDRTLLVPSSAEQSTGSIIIRTPQKINITKPEMTFKWSPLKGNTGYRFVITDKFNREIYSFRTIDTILLVNFTLLPKKIDEDNYYFWFVESESDPEIKSAVSCFQICSKAKTDEIIKEFEKLKSELGNEETALNYLTYAAFFEENHFLNEAKEYYLKAIELEPEVAEFQVLYQLFLQKSQQ